MVEVASQLDASADLATEKPLAESDGTVPGDALAEAAPATELPQRFGRYQVKRCLGRGSMGSVYLAHDDQLERDVAIKVPRFPADESEFDGERFLREARAAAALHHVNLCPVYDVGSHEGTPYLTMAYIDGQSLADRIKTDWVWPQSAAMALVRQLALALAEAHRCGVIHRDLKPANIMLNHRQEPVIMDFGLARRVDRDEDGPTTELIGTPAYMAPEQAKGDRQVTGPACDIYSLGVILYELVTGRLPFQGRPAAVLAQVAMVDVPPPSRHRADLDPKLEAIILRALAKRPSDRFPTMAVFADALLDNSPTPRRDPKQRRSWRTWAAVAAGIAVGFVSLMPASRSKDRPADAGSRQTSGEPSAPGVKRAPVAAAISAGRDDTVSRGNSAAGQQQPNAEACLLRGRASLQRGDYAHAIADFTDAIHLDPDSAWAYVNRGAAHLQRGQLDAAQADFDFALRLAPGNATAQKFRDLLTSFRGDWP
jgi:serine/threonine protein kinase